PNIPFDQAIEQFNLCLATFYEKLNGFDPKKCGYHFTYNRSTPELVQWLIPKFAIVRIGGTGMLSEPDLAARILHSTAFGPEDPYDFFLTQIEICRQTRPSAFFFCLHGLDGEAWGATSSDNLRRILDLLTSDPVFEYWPVP